MTYKKFEELPCWMMARELCKIVFSLFREGPLSRDYSLRDQMWKASGSVMDNIAEGFDDGSRREFIRFLGYSQRSCGELQSQLYRALDCGYLDQDSFQHAYDAAENCRKQVKGFRKYLRSCKDFFAVSPESSNS
ncbi:MAG: four helix bundle protein [Planctomycetota bacterium]|jgi:four helix bundle protein